MHLHDLVLFHPPYTAENLPKVTELVSEDVRQRYYDFIWEPCNRHTFARPEIDSRIERESFPIPHATPVITTLPEEMSSTGFPALPTPSWQPNG